MIASSRPLPYGNIPLGRDDHPDHPYGQEPEPVAGDLKPCSDPELYVGFEAKGSLQWCVWCGQDFIWQGAIPVLCQDCWKGRVSRS